MFMEKTDDDFCFVHLAENSGNSVSDIFLSLMNRTLRNKNSPLLPDSKGLVDNYPAVDIATDREIKGMSGILLSSKKYDEMFSQNFWIEAKVAFKLGLHSIDKPTAILVRKESGVEPVKYFNISQFYEPSQTIIELTTEVRRENKIARRKSSFTTSGYPPLGTVSNHGHFGYTKLGRKSITIRTPDVQEYLRLYLKSIDEKVPLFVDKETAEQFRLNALQALRHKKVFHKILPDGIRVDGRVNTFKWLLSKAIKARREERALVSQKSSMNKNDTRQGKEKSFLMER